MSAHTLRADGVSPSSPPLPQTDEQPTQTGTMSRRVLVVDDEQLIADTIVKILRMHGYEAHSAYTAEEALRMALTLRPQVLLSDVMMPVLNGVQLAIAMEKLVPSIQIMLFSGQAGSHHLPDRELVMDLGYTIVSKPLHPDRLLSTLRGLAKRCAA